MMSSLAQQSHPEGVRVLRNRVVGRPVQAPVAPVTPVVLVAPSSKPLPPGTIASTEIAQAGAIQRIGTEEGWRQMNVWLKNADKEQKVPHLMNLLKQCLQASISVALLTTNDTPKFVKKLSITHSDSEIKSLSVQCVSKWKKEISAPSVPAPVKKTVKRKTTMDRVVEEENEQKELDIKSSTMPTKSEAKKPEKRRLSNENDKTKGSSSDAQPPESKKPKKEEEVAGNKTKKPDTVAFSPTSAVKMPKRPMPKKVSAATMSSGFMDALAVNTEPKKIPLPKKKVEPKNPVVTDLLSSVLDSMDADCKVEPHRRAKTPTPPPAVAIPDDPVASPPRRRKIRFADECGKDLFFVREFKIEHGERINVNRMSAEDMKHHEMMMDRKWKEESGEKVDEDEEDEEVATAAVPEVAWRLLSIDNISCTIQHGINSKEKEIEAKRRETALRAFNHPDFPSEISGDPEDFDPVAASMHVPLMIPLVPEELNSGVYQPTPAPAPVVDQKKIVLPDNLKYLLDGLKKKGIVSDGPAAATTTATTTTSDLVPGLPTLGSFSNTGATASTAPMIQQQMPPQQYGRQPQIQQVGYGQQYGEAQQQQSQYPQGMRSPQHQLQQYYPPMDKGRDMSMAGPSGGPQSPPESKICRMFAHDGRCRFGNRCRFSHDLQAPGNFRGGDRRKDWSGRGRKGRGGGDGHWRGGKDRGEPYNRNGPRKHWRDNRRNYDGASPPYQQCPSMHSPSIRSPPFDGTPSEFPDVVVIPSERVD